MKLGLRLGLLLLLPAPSAGAGCRLDQGENVASADAPERRCVCRAGFFGAAVEEVAGGAAQEPAPAGKGYRSDSCEWRANETECLRVLPLAGCTADAGCPLVECAWQAACGSAPVTRAPESCTAAAVHSCIDVPLGRARSRGQCEATEGCTYVPAVAAVPGAVAHVDEACIATAAEQCAAVELDGERATCEDEPGCEYTAADVVGPTETDTARCANVTALDDPSACEAIFTNRSDLDRPQQACEYIAHTCQRKGSATAVRPGCVQGSWSGASAPELEAPAESGAAGPRVAKKQTSRDPASSNDDCLVVKAAGVLGATHFKGTCPGGQPLHGAPGAGGPALGLGNGTYVSRLGAGWAGDIEPREIVAPIFPQPGFWIDVNDAAVLLQALGDCARDGTASVPGAAGPQAQRLADPRCDEGPNLPVLTCSPPHVCRGSSIGIDWRPAKDDPLQSRPFEHHPETSCVEPPHFCRANHHGRFCAKCEDGYRKRADGLCCRNGGADEEYPLQALLFMVLWSLFIVYSNVSVDATDSSIGSLTFFVQSLAMIYSTDELTQSEFAGSIRDSSVAAKIQEWMEIFIQQANMETPGVEMDVLADPCASPACERFDFSVVQNVYYRLVTWFVSWVFGVACFWLFDKILRSTFNDLRARYKIYKATMIAEASLIMRRGKNEPNVLHSARRVEQALRSLPHQRSQAQVEELYLWLQGVDVLQENVTDSYIKKELCKHLSLVSVSAGDALYRQGDEGDAFFVLISGEASIEVDKHLNVRTVAGSTNQPSSFGEGALHDEGDRRTASVIAKTDCTLARLDAADYRSIIGMRQSPEPEPQPAAESHESAVLDQSQQLVNLRAQLLRLELDDLSSRAVGAGVDESRVAKAMRLPPADVKPQLIKLIVKRINHNNTPEDYSGGGFFVGVYRRFAGCELDFDVDQYGGERKVEYYRQLFELFEGANNGEMDGKITLEDLGKVITFLGYVGIRRKDELVQDMLMRHDTDHSGALDFREFVEFLHDKRFNPHAARDETPRTKKTTSLYDVRNGAGDSGFPCRGRAAEYHVDRDGKIWTRVVYDAIIREAPGQADLALHKPNLHKPARPGTLTDRHAQYLQYCPDLPTEDNFISYVEHANVRRTLPDQTQISAPGPSEWLSLDEFQEAHQAYSQARDRYDRRKLRAVAMRIFLGTYTFYFQPLTQACLNILVPRVYWHWKPGDSNPARDLLLDADPGVTFFDCGYGESAASAEFNCTDVFHFPSDLGVLLGFERTLPPSGIPLGRGVANRPPDQQTDMHRQHWPAYIVAMTALVLMVLIIPVLINRGSKRELGHGLGSNYRHSRSVGALLTQYGQERDKEIRKDKEKKLCYLEEAHAAEDEFREAMDGAEDLDAGAEKEQLQATATRAAELAEAHFRKALKGDPKNLFCAEVCAAGKCPGDRVVCGDLCNCIIEKELKQLLEDRGASGSPNRRRQKSTFGERSASQPALARQTSAERRSLSRSKSTVARQPSRSSPDGRSSPERSSPQPGAVDDSVSVASSADSTAEEKESQTKFMENVRAQVLSDPLFKYSAVYNKYDPEHVSYWFTELMRKLLLNLAFTFLDEKKAQFGLAFVVMLGSLWIHLYYKPFPSQETNKLEQVVLFCLLFAVYTKSAGFNAEILIIGIVAIVILNTFATKFKVYRRLSENILRIRDLVSDCTRRLTSGRAVTCCQNWRCCKKDVSEIPEKLSLSVEVPSHAEDHSVEVEDGPLSAPVQTASRGARCSVELRDAVSSIFARTFCVALVVWGLFFDLVLGCLIPLLAEDWCDALSDFGGVACNERLDAIDAAGSYGYSCPTHADRLAVMYCWHNALCGVVRLAAGWNYSNRGLWVVCMASMPVQAAMHVALVDTLADAAWMCLLCGCAALYMYATVPDETAPIMYQKLPTEETEDDDSPLRELRRYAGGAGGVYAR